MKNTALQCPFFSNKCLICKVFSLVLLSSVLALSTSAMAFGGGGGGRTEHAYDRGLNAIGIHYGDEGQADIKFKCDDPNAHPDNQGVCVCNDGYVEDTQGVCVQNQCEGFTPTECILTCDPVTGEKTYATLCHNDEYYCNNNHECINPCDEGEHPTDACIPSWHAEAGTCVADYAEAGTSCGENMTCDGAGSCVCAEGYKEVDGKCYLAQEGESCGTNKVFDNSLTCVCAEGYEDVGGTCMAKCPTAITRNTDNSCTVCENGNVYLSYNEDPCGTQTAFEGCKSNKDCADGEFCELIGDCNNDCSVVTGGTCVSLHSGDEITYENGSDKKSFLESGMPMNWWTAENWCKAHHKSLVSYHTLNNLFDCEKMDSYVTACTWDKFVTDDYWNGRTPSQFYWTAENYDSCIAWRLFLFDYKEFGPAGYRCYDEYYVLCE